MARNNNTGTVTHTYAADEKYPYTVEFYSGTAHVGRGFSKVGFAEAERDLPSSLRRPEDVAEYEALLAAQNNKRARELAPSANPKNVLVTKLGANNTQQKRGELKYLMDVYAEMHHDLERVNYAHTSDVIKANMDAVVDRILALTQNEQ